MKQKDLFKLDLEDILPNADVFTCESYLDEAELEMIRDDVRYIQVLNSKLVRLLYSSEDNPILMVSTEIYHRLPKKLKDGPITIIHNNKLDAYVSHGPLVDVHTSLAVGWKDSSRKEHYYMKVLSL